MQAERVPFQRFAAVLGRVVAQSTAAATDAALKRAGDELAQSAEAALSSGSFVGYLSLVVPHLGLLFKGDTASQALSLYQLVISAFRAADVQASDKLVGLVNTFVGGVFVDAPVGSGSLVRLSVYA